MILKLGAKLRSASLYSFDGCKFLLRNEFAARIEVYGFFWAMVALILLRVSLVTLGIAAILFLILLAIEALNTAVEVIINRVSPEISPAGKRAKDLGSFAVFCAIAANTIFFIGAVMRSAPAASFWAYLKTLAA